MDGVKVRMEDWNFTQGLVGVKRILNHSDIAVKTDATGIWLTKEALDELPAAYFRFFLDKYSTAERTEKVLRRWHSKWKKGEKSYKKDLNARLKKLTDSAARYFAELSTYQMMDKKIASYREAKEYFAELDETLEDIIAYMHDKEINEKLTSNIFKAVHLKNHYGQVSFLNVSKNSLKLHEQVEQIHEDFVQPVLDELDFMAYVKAGDTDRALKMLEKVDAVKPKKPLATLKNKLKKKTADEMAAYIREEVLKCSITDFELGMYDLDEGVFSPLALSMGTLNTTWDAEGKRHFPISALTRLILFCAAAGAATSGGKSTFVMFDGSFEAIYDTNDSYYKNIGIDRTFEEIVFDVARENKHRADKLRINYLIVEYESDYDTKKTLLDYVIMTPNLVSLFAKHEQDFQHMYYVDKNEFVKLLLKGIDTKHFITSKLREKVQKGYATLDIVSMSILRHFNQFYSKKGENSMDAAKQKSYVWAIFKSAEQIRYKIGLKKAQGTAYRLLNAVQAGNKHTFLDTVMRLYVANEIEMPGLLLEVLHEDRLDFETVANSWVAGLISKPIEENDKNAK